MEGKGREERERRGVEKDGDGGEEGKQREEKEEKKEGGKEAGDIFIWGAFSSAPYNDEAALWSCLQLAEQALYPGGTTQEPRNGGGPRAVPLCGHSSVRAKGRARARDRKSVV